ncbi:MAG: helix-turn-helix domain-containing protein, partial [Clostridiales bacterium]|nr:helix-turn-helix domain-containing protein [Clostridiales bacterium]
MEFKDRLKQYRQDNNLTQDELAEKLFISRQAVSKYETGRGYPAIDVMTELSRLMGISIDELISKEELAKQTIYTGQEVRKNKRNIIIAISMIIVVIIISVVAIVLSSKSMQQSGQPASAAPKYDYDLV